MNGENMDKFTKKENMQKHVILVTQAMLVMTTMLTSIAGNLPTTADIKVTLHYCSDHLCL